MAGKSYKMSYCVRCRCKTGWSGAATLKLTRNRVPALCGRCCRCKGNKFTFITWCFYKRESQKCRRRRRC